MANCHRRRSRIEDQSSDIAFAHIGRLCFAVLATIIMDATLCKLLPHIFARRHPSFNQNEAVKRSLFIKRCYSRFFGLHSLLRQHNICLLIRIAIELSIFAIENRHISAKKTI